MFVPQGRREGEGPQKRCLSSRMMARSTECRKQLCLTQNPLFNDPPFLPFLAEEGWREGYRGKWILKRPPGTGMDRGRKKSQILQQQEQEGSRLEAGAAATLATRRRRNYQASKDRRTSRRNFFIDIPPPSVGWSVCFLTTNVNQAQLSSCQGVIKNKKV